MGTKFEAGTQLDVAFCVQQCLGDTAIDKANPNPDGSYKACNFFNAYLGYTNGQIDGTHCAEFTTTYGSPYDTDVGQNQNGAYDAVECSFGYSLNPQDCGSIDCSSSSSSSTTSSATSSAAATILPLSSNQILSSSTSTSTFVSSTPSMPTPPIVLPTSTIATSSAENLNSVPGPSSSSAILSSSPTSSAEATILPLSSDQISSTDTSTTGSIGGNPSLSNPSGSSLISPASASLSVTASSSAAPAPATTAPICPSADGGSFIFNGQEFVVGCGIASDQAYYARIAGTDIADCVHICTTSTGTPACEAVTFSDGFCYLKTDPGAVYNEGGSDSAFVISTPSGPETIVSGYLSGNISQAAPACPAANGNTFESNGYVYVVGCNIDNSVVDISTASGADLATCVVSCVSYSGTLSCAAVTYNNGNCHFKGLVGTVFHNEGADTAFIIADNANVNSVASSPSPTQLGSLPFGNPSLPPNPTGTYTISSGSEVVVYMPLNETCP